MVSGQRVQRASNLGKSLQWGFFVFLHICTIVLIIHIICTVLTISDTSSTSTLSFQDSLKSQERWGLHRGRYDLEQPVNRRKPTRRFLGASGEAARQPEDASPRAARRDIWKRKPATLGYVATTSDITSLKPTKYDTVKTRGLWWI